MTMMVDSSLAGSLKPAPTGAPIVGGAPAPTGIAALFSALMNGVASPAVAGQPIAPEMPATAAEGTDDAVLGAIAPVEPMPEAPSLAAEMTTYLDQLKIKLEPKEVVSSPVIKPVEVKQTAAPDAPVDEAQDEDQAIDTASPTATYPVAAPVVPSAAPIAAPFVPAEAPRAQSPVLALPRQDEASKPIAKPTTATVIAAVKPETGTSQPLPDLAAAIAAFTQQQGGTSQPLPDLAVAVAAFTQQQGGASKPASMAKPTQPAVFPIGIPKSEIAVAQSPLTTTAPDKPSLDSAAPVQSQTAAAPVSAPTPTTAQPLAAGASQPVADIGSMLGQQVIDMGSGGQWIDGLAREIAALGKGEGQGSFRLSPEHLGPMRVDIRAGDQGTNVTLTVETKAAEAMLVQDRHLLKADAQLSALRIGDVTVERVAHVAEPGRTDGASGQGTSGQQGNNAQNAALTQGQSQGQSQNNGQSAANRKVPDAATVSSEAEPREAGGNAPADATRRARYA